jgi:hypothetical protein
MMNLCWIWIPLLREKKNGSLRQGIGFIICVLGVYLSLSSTLRLCLDKLKLTEWSGTEWNGMERNGMERNKHSILLFGYFMMERN